MCSVVGCDSWRRGAQRFTLPEDPEIRHKWLRFVAEDLNGQLLRRFNESSWADIVVCKEHFLEECFEKPADADGGQLKPSAVPTVRIKSEDDESMPILHQEVPIKSEDDAGPYFETMPQSPEHTLSMQHGDSELLQDEHKPLVSNTCLNKLFPHKCPSCSYNLQTETFTEESLFTLTQQCPLCEYRNEFRREISANEQPSRGSIGVTIKQEELTDECFCESDTFGPIEDKSGASKEEEEESGDSGGTLDELSNEWTLISQKDPEGKSQGDEVFSGHLLVQQPCGQCGAQSCVHRLKPYVCSVCGKRCISSVSLKRHAYTHDDNYEYKCKYCHATFKTRREKILHEQIHDYSPKPYKCLVCPETFASTSERSIHLKSHKNRKERPCELCGFICSTYQTLQRHMLVHSGVKPFKCSVCERAFNQDGQLKSHMRQHTGEKPYKCQHCDKSFTHNVSLKNHIQRYHSPDSVQQ